MCARKATQRGPELTAAARLRLATVIDTAEAHHTVRRDAYLNERAWRMRMPEPLHDGTLHLVQFNFGKDLSARGTPRELCEQASLDDLVQYLRACFAQLHNWEERSFYQMTSAEFERHVNRIFAEDEFPYRMSAGSVLPLASSETEALRRTLLANPADMAACEQGDVQVEIVVSSIQERLKNPGAVLVDYGCGLGRVLQGLSSAPRFKAATYVAVDDPIPQGVRQLAGDVGARAEFIRRPKYLASPVGADVILAVNVLHHIPFADLPDQLSTLLHSLKSDGLLVVHEINELRNPEQRNVPWAFEDIFRLLNISCLELNPRTTQTKRTRTPLSNVMVSLRADPQTLHAELVRSTEAVWKQMKERTLTSISAMYADANEEAHLELQHALIANANLDLNKPLDP